MYLDNEVGYTVSAYLNDTIHTVEDMKKITTGL